MSNFSSISMAPLIAALAAQVTVVDGIVDEILVDTDITIPLGLNAVLTEIGVVDGNVDILTQEADQRSVPKVYSNSYNGTAFTDIVNITDKGVLTGISTFLTQYTAASFIHWKIIVDGVTLYDGEIMSFSEKGQAKSLSFNHKFDTSLQVQHKIVTASKGTVRTEVSCTVDA